MQRCAQKKIWPILLALFACGALWRANIHAPFVGPDSRLYINLANNLVVNGCYSTSDSRTAQCRPSWGSQPPGYPVFIAAFKLVGYDRPNDIVIAQVMIFALAVITILAASAHWTTSAITLCLPGIVLMASPLTSGYSPYILTETLAAASTLFMFASLAYSLRSGQLSIFFTALALLWATLLRWDQLSLVSAIGLVAFYLHPLRVALLRIVVVLLPTAVAYALLMIRAAVVGLPLIPSLIADNAIPPGILSFWHVATVTQMANETFLWRVWDAPTYKDIPSTFDYGAFAPSINTPRLHDLIERLGEIPDGAPIPGELDAEFGALAADFEASHPLNTYVLVPLMRAWHLWMGTDQLLYFGWAFPAASYEGARVAYRILLLVIAFFLLMRARTRTSMRAFIGAVLLYLMGRTVFLVMLSAVELRYLVPMIPPLELLPFFLTSRNVSSNDHSHANTGEEP